MPPDEYRSALVAVAHPDDELIFFGGLLERLLHGGWRVDVIWATGRFGSRARTRVRHSELERAADVLGVEGTSLELEDTPGPLPARALRERLAERVAGRAYDDVYTHGVWGEYGHRHHIDVCVAVHRTLGRAWSLAGPFPPERILVLDRAARQRKRQLARRLYPSQWFAPQWCSHEERLVYLTEAAAETFALVAGAHSEEEKRALAELPLDGALAASARTAVHTLIERNPPWAELARLPEPLWAPRRTLWRLRLEVLLASADRLDEPLGAARAHAADRLGATREERA